MRWHRQTNFHNSRNYEDETPRAVTVSQARLAFAWLIDAVRRKFDKAMRPGPTRRSDVNLVKAGDGRGFTVLGSAIPHHAVHESAMTCAFPEQDDASARQRFAHRLTDRSPHRSQYGSTSDSSTRPSGH